MLYTIIMYLFMGHSTALIQYHSGVDDIIPTMYVCVKK